MNKTPRVVPRLFVCADMLTTPSTAWRRYESFWINFMEEELDLCPGTLVVAHGTAADACLRYTENHQVRTLRTGKGRGPVV